MSEATTVKMKTAKGTARAPKIKRMARTVSKSARNQAAGTFNSQDSSPPLVETSHFVGVRERGEGGISLEVRTSSAGYPNAKIHAGGFHDREYAAMAHDVARLCHLGRAAYLKLRKAKLNCWNHREYLADLLCKDSRMTDLTDKHKERAGQNWDEAMKTSLSELASYALKKIEEEAAVPQQPAAIDGQNSNWDIDEGLQHENGGGPANWPHAKENLRSLSPKLPEPSVEEQVRELLGEIDLLKAENRDLKAVNQLHAGNHADGVFQRNQRFPEGDGPVLGSQADQAATSDISWSEMFDFEAFDSIGELSQSRHQPATTRAPL